MACEGEVITVKKKVWILNHHANDTYFDEGGRHYYLAKYLKQAGYEPVIFCSNAQHGTGKVYFNDLKLWQEHIAEKINVPFVFIKGRPYIGNGKNRILCMLDYYRYVQCVAAEYVQKNGYPDIIIGSSVHPFAVLAAEKLAKKYGIPCICEIRDLWPESIVAVGMASKYNPAVLFLRQLEKQLYIKSDAIIFTIPGGYDYIKERHWNKIIPMEKVHHINNGVDLEDFDSNAKTNDYKDKDLEDPSIFKIVYTGSIRQANGIDELVDCAIKMQYNKNVVFLVYGDGDYREKLEKRIKESGNVNVIFKGKVEKKYIPYILSKSNLNLLNYNATAAAGFYRFGSSQNKLFEYLASGKPIISNYKANYDLIERNNCGISKNMLDSDSYLEALNEIVNMSKDEYDILCNNSRKVAQKYDYKKLAEDLIQVIESV